MAMEGRLLNLINATRSLDTQRVTQILNENARENYDSCANNDMSPLMEISCSNAFRPETFAIAKLLLKKKADPNLANGRQGWTALYFAAQYSNALLCKLLIDFGAKIELQDQKNKQTALFHVNDLLYRPHPEKSDEQIEDTIKTLITTIPLSEYEAIRKNIIFLGLLKSKTIIPRDVRRLMASYIIDGLIQKQMNRIENVLRIENRDIHNACQHVARSGHNTNPKIHALLSQYNLHSNQEIRKEVANNIKRILFGKSIQEKQKEQTHYALLGISKDASEYEIRKAYCTLYVQMREAFNTLLVPAKRTAYDQELSKEAPDAESKDIGE